VRHYCSLCGSDESTEEKQTPDGRRFVTCSDRSHGKEPWVWEPTDPKQGSSRHDGLGAELGIWDKLLECFTPGEGFVAYGEIEDRFLIAFPDEAHRLLLAYGHRWRDPDHPATQYSMSAYLASRLKELEREGHLALSWGPALGPWAYNEVISHWRLAGSA
jgi:hypothetical protein